MVAGSDPTKTDKKEVKKMKFNYIATLNILLLITALTANGDNFNDYSKDSQLQELSPPVRCFFDAAAQNDRTALMTCFADDVAVSGNAKASIVPDTETAEPPELGYHETSITRVHGIVEVSFRAFGIHYDIMVECWDHQYDPRCVEDTYILELVEGLKMASDKATS